MTENSPEHTEPQDSYVMRTLNYWEMTGRSRVMGPGVREYPTPGNDDLGLSGDGSRTFSFSFEGDKWEVTFDEP